MLLKMIMSCLQQLAMQQKYELILFLSAWAFLYAHSGFVVNVVHGIVKNSLYISKG